jgi:nicotinamidase-related amidase
MSEPRLRDRTELAVKRGREAAERIADLVKAEQAKRRDVLSVTVSRRVADAMKAYFESFTRFDGILPQHCHGAPFYIDLSAEKDYVIRSRAKGH